MCFSTHGKALSGSIQGQGNVPFASRVSRWAMVRYASIQTGQKDAGRFGDLIRDYRALLQLKLERRPEQWLRHLEQLLRHRHQLVRQASA
jgi:hypothetical protein